jgi:hypothetical protein
MENIPETSEIFFLLSISMECIDILNNLSKKNLKGVYYKSATALFLPIKEKYTKLR